MKIPAQTPNSRPSSSACARRSSDRDDLPARWRFDLLAQPWIAAAFVLQWFGVLVLGISEISGPGGWKIVFVTSVLSTALLSWPAVWRDLLLRGASAPRALLFSDDPAQKARLLLAGGRQVPVRCCAGGLCTPDWLWLVVQDPDQRRHYLVLRRPPACGDGHAAFAALGRRLRAVALAQRKGPDAAGTSR